MTRLRTLLLGAAAFAGFACASAEPPPGGPPDREPPRLLQVSPEPNSIVPGWDRPVVFQFDERLSERGIREAVLVSPETGEVRVRKKGSRLEVSIEGGWREGQIYRVVVLPGVLDLFGNARKEAVEVVFSTGPEIPNTVVAGTVVDRLTGKPVAGARVEAIHQPDSTTYVELTDSAGMFVFLRIPTGEYRLQAYRDENRNRRPDFFEIQDTARTALAMNDTALHALALLAPDTTPARLMRAEARDSLQVRLFFDDALDPLQPLTGAEFGLWQLPESTAVAVAAVLYPHEWERQRAEAAAAAQPQDTTGVPQDTIRQPQDTIRQPRHTTGQERLRPGPSAQDSTLPLPTRELVLIPGVALRPGGRYRVEARGITNVAGVSGGGGSVAFDAPAAAPPDTARAPVEPDSAGGQVAPPDTLNR
jgi:hypothetical protein